MTSMRAGKSNCMVSRATWPRRRWVWEAFDLQVIGGATGLERLKEMVAICGHQAQRHRGHQRLAGFRRKSDGSWVTDTDLQVERSLRGFISKHHPKANFLAEEEGATSGEPGCDLRFIVDPIDGTDAYVRGLPSWSVLVGIEHQGVPAVGICFLPDAHRFVVAVRGFGATSNGQPLQSSRHSRLCEASIQLARLDAFSAERRNRGLGNLMSAGVRLYGHCDALGHAMVWEGRCEAMIDPIVSAWDLCALSVIHLEAGGMFSDLTGRATVWGGSCLASNSLLHQKILDRYNA